MLQVGRGRVLSLALQTLVCSVGIGCLRFTTDNNLFGQMMNNDGKYQTWFNLAILILDGAFIAWLGGKLAKYLNIRRHLIVLAMLGLIGADLVDNAIVHYEGGVRFAYNVPQGSGAHESFAASLMECAVYFSVVMMLFFSALLVLLSPVLLVLRAKQKRAL